MNRRKLIDTLNWSQISHVKMGLDSMIRIVAAWSPCLLRASSILRIIFKFARSEDALRLIANGRRSVWKCQPPVYAARGGSAGPRLTFSPYAFGTSLKISASNSIESGFKRLFARRA